MIKSKVVVLCSKLLTCLILQRNFGNIYLCIYVVLFMLFFIFSNTLYKEIDEVGMGSPLGPLNFLFDQLKPFQTCLNLYYFNMPFTIET